MIVFGLSSSVGFSQLKKFYSVKESNEFDTIKFSLDATFGNCMIAPANEGPISIYGNPDLKKINPSFKVNVDERVCNVSLDLQKFKSTSVGEGFVFSMLSDEGSNNDFWKIYFDHQKVYNLDLHYGFGNADIDLGGVAVNNFKIKSGSADVLIDYSSDQANLIEMDTFMVKVDMGSIYAKNLDLAKANLVVANVGFGKAVLDLSNAVNKKCKVEASVGAGNLEIIIPSEEVPMIIYLKDSPFCEIKLSEGFEQVERNVYVNRYYVAGASNLLIFNIDVALGNISFHSD
jgi:hypothetical protein